MKSTAKKLVLTGVILAFCVVVLAINFPQLAAPTQERKQEGKQISKPGFEVQLQNVQKITSDAGFTNPVWSPTEPDTLAFASPEAPGTFVLSLSDGRIRTVTNEIAGFKFFWSRDGKSIIYRTQIDEEAMAIKQIEIDTGAISTLVQSMDLSLPQEVKGGLIRYKDMQEHKSVKSAKAISAKDEVPFVYQDKDQIYAVVAGETKQITADDGQYFLPLLSPDGSKVLYQELSRGLYVTDFKTNITTHLGLGDDASWSSDSRFIIFEVTTDDSHTIISSELYVANLVGDRVQLTNTPELNELRPSWSSDGKHIAFEAKGAIYVATIVFGR